MLYEKDTKNDTVDKKAKESLDCQKSIAIFSLTIDKEIAIFLPIF